jgi:sporulation protein YlmC with PRC-barrel domain
VECVDGPGGKSTATILDPIKERVTHLVVKEPGMLAIPHEHIPPGEVEIRRGDDVEAADGHVGRVDEFLVNPSNGGITHLVMREGHLWGTKDVTIPVAQILRIADGVVHLKLTRADVEALPSVPVRRR